ncbi:MAG: response regulator [Desulfobacterales bacterium]|jgi:DNA-binding NtrC family response regulator|nr:response regulator [Desulfobacterales bacterium]
MKTEGFNVLLVDDEPDFLYPLVKRLVKRQLNVETAGSGREAIQLIAEKPFDVVVVDVKMPGMSGLEVLRTIKAAKALTEVIILSGHASMDAAIEGMEQGAFDYLMKPVDFDELFFKLQDAYKKKMIQEQKILQMKERRDQG